MYSRNYSISSAPKSLKEIENLQIDSDEEEDDNTSIYSYKSSRSSISEVTLPNSLLNPSLVKNQYPTIHESQYEEEEEDEEEYEELNDDNPDFLLFKEEVKKWITLDDDIRVLQKALNERKKLKNEITPRILEFMGKYEIENLNTQDGGRLEYSKTSVTKPLSKDYLKHKLSEFLRSMDKAEKCTNFIMNGREKVDKVVLKRVFK